MLKSRRGVVGSLWVTLVAAVGLVLGLVVAPAATASGTGAGAGEASTAAADASASGASETSGGGAAAAVDPVAYINAQNTGQVIDISAAGSGKHACAVTDAGAAYCWGSNLDRNGNFAGQLGSGGDEDGEPSPAQALVPVPVKGLSNVAQISAGFEHTCAVTDAGAAFCWGSNDYGELGNGELGGQSTKPVQVKGVGGAGVLSNVSQISAGGFEFRSDVAHTCAVTDTGAAYCWGSNDYGELGNGELGGQSKTPVRVKGFGGKGFLSNVTQISAGGNHTCAVIAARGGVASCWGSNEYGQLGDGSSTGPDTCGSFGACSWTPVKVLNSEADGFVNGQVTQISAGRNYSCAVTTATDGNAFCWGTNNNGQLGNGQGGQFPTPVQVCAAGVTDGSGSCDGEFLSRVTQISAGMLSTCAVTDASGGSAFCWGSNEEGQLGDGGGSSSSKVPVQVKGVGGTGVLSNVTQVSAGGRFSCAVVSGTALCWGVNDVGQLGNGKGGASGAKSTTPVAVAGQLSIVPNPVEFGEVKVGSSETQDVQVTSTFLTPVGLDSVKEEGSRASFEWQVCEATAAIVAVIDPGTGCVGRALFAPDEPGSYAVSLLLEPYALDADGEPTKKLSGSLEFSVSGNAPCVKDCGPVVLGKPNPVDFGSVALGEIATDSVRLVNDGDKTLRISKVTAADSDGEFSVVDPDECVDVALRPDQGCSMQVRFSPESAGSRAGVLQVTSNSKAKTNTIGLTGMGEAAVIGKPGKVRKLQAPKKKIKASKALVKWKEPKGEVTVTKYQTRIKKCQQKKNGKWNCKKPKWQKWKKKKPVANAKGWIKRNLTQLQPGTKYKVQVRAWSGDNKGPKSGITFTTKRSGIPTKPGNG
jgi:alpha-tubulin suppressor-like RCC1 family protein